MNKEVFEVLYKSYIKPIEGIFKSCLKENWIFSVADFNQEKNHEKVSGLSHYFKCLAVAYQHWFV